MNRNLVTNVLALVVLAIASQSAVGESEASKNWDTVVPLTTDKPFANAARISLARQQKYHRDQMSGRQRSAYEFELQVIEKEKSMFDWRASILRRYGVTLDVPVPLRLTAAEVAQIEKFRMGVLINSDILTNGIVRRLELMNSRLHADYVAVVKAWRNANPAAAAAEDVAWAEADRRRAAERAKMDAASAGLAAAIAKRRADAEAVLAKERAEQEVAAANRRAEQEVAAANRRADEAARRADEAEQKAAGEQADVARLRRDVELHTGYFLRGDTADELRRDIQLHTGYFLRGDTADELRRDLRLKGVLDL